VNSRKKILFVAGNVEHLYQFVIHGFFKELSETSSIYLTLPEQDLGSERWIDIATHLDGVFTEVLPYTYSARAKKAGYQLGAALTYRHRKLSKSYQVRILERLFGGLGVPMKLSSLQSLKIMFKNRGEIFKRIVHEFPAMARGTHLCFWIWSKFKTRQTNLGCSLGDTFKTVSADAVVILMQRQAGFVIAAIASGEKFQIPTLLIPYKWDNASSKSPLIRTPTKMLVYNSAIKEVCARLHKMSTASVVAVGSVEICIGQGSLLRGKSLYVPLVGANGNTVSATKWLVCISSLTRADTPMTKFGSLQLIWRPYPTSEKNNLDFMREFVLKHPQIELDKDISVGASHRSNSVSFAELKDAYFRYISLLESSSFVISEGTSVIVDARARGLAVIYPAFKQNAVVGSQWHRLNTSNHLKGLRETKGVFIAEDEEELKRLVVDFLENPRRIPPDNSGENIFVDERTYAQRVLDVIDDAIAEKSKQRD
jgi:hypothetical protein